MTESKLPRGDDQPLVSVIVPTMNRSDKVSACLQSIIESSYRNIEVIIVDNGSTDNTVAALQANFGQIEYVIIQASLNNLGAGGGRNAGADLARGKLLLFVDDDNIVHPKMIEELVAFMSARQDCILVGPMMFYHDDPAIIWMKSCRINMLTSRAEYQGTGERYSGNHDEIIETGHLPNCFMTTREAFCAIGGFEEKYIVMYEEADFAYVLKKRFNKKAFVVGAAIIFHKVQLYGEKEAAGKPLYTPISEMRAWLIARNRVYFMRRHATTRQFTVFAVVFLPISVIFYIYQIICDREYRMAWKYLTGTFRGIFMK